MTPTPRLTREDLLTTFGSYGRSRHAWLVGGEFERHILGPNGWPAPYEGRSGIRHLLQRFAADGWKPKYEAGALIELGRNKAAITLEPGGQFELSGAPFRTASEVTAEADRFARDVDRLLADTSLSQVAMGLTPFAPIPAIGWVPKGRYAIMQRHMASSGPLGHHMMKGTAATQASFDFSDEQDCAAKVRVGTLLAPLVTAMFASSPYEKGRATGWKSTRGYVWTLTDPARTGFPDAASSFTHERWVDYLLDVPMMFTRHGGTWRAANGRSFRSWMTEGDEGRFPQTDDWDLHLTSVFPEVRVKHQIEMRMGDCVPVALAGAFVALWRGLLYDPRALQGALALAERVDHYGDRMQRFVAASRHGLEAQLGGRSMVAWCQEAFDLAAGGLERLGDGDRPLLAPLGELLQAGQSPADQMLDALGPTPDPAALRAWTHPLGGPSSSPV